MNNENITMSDTLHHAENMTICTINYLYDDTKDDECLSCEEMQKLKYALQTLSEIHCLKDKIKQTRTL